MLYSFAKNLFLLIFKFLCHWEVEGRENVPLDGPVLLAANHVSFWDPIAVGVASRRPVYFMAKEELFRIPVFGSILRALRAFPVKRGKSDRAALRAAMEILKEDKVLGMFPEGGRVRGGELGPFKEGAAMIALRTGAPVVPIAVVNSTKIFSRGWFRPFKVRIGKPMVFPELYGQKYTSQQVKEVTAQIRQAVLELLNG